jgi:hypothetical protein
MHVVWHQVPFDDLTLFLPCQFVEDRPQVFADIPKHRLAASFGNEDNMVLAIPFRMGHALE